LTRSTQAVGYSSLNRNPVVLGSGIYSLDGKGGNKLSSAFL